MSEYTPTTSEVREQFARGARGGYGGSAEAGAHRHVAAQNKFDRWIAEVERAAAAQARGEAIIETVQAHRDLHKTYGSTSACRGGVGGQALTSHCAEICYNAGAHEKEMEAWQRLEVEAIEYSRARAAEIRKGKNE